MSEKFVQEIPWNFLKITRIKIPVLNSSEEKIFKKYLYLCKLVPSKFSQIFYFSKNK